MIRKIAIAALLLSASSAHAHEVWVERDGAGPARIYLGEPGEALPEGGDPQFDNLKTPRLVPESAAVQVRKTGYIEVQVPAGDVRVQDDNVFAPWGPEGKKEGVVYFARAGRAEARAALPFEIVPTTPGGNRFSLMRDGKAIPGASITIVSPDKWSKTIKTDASGALALPIREKGRYLLSASAKDEGNFFARDGMIGILHRITTTTFVVN